MRSRSHRDRSHYWFETGARAERRVILDGVSILSAVWSVSALTIDIIAGGVIADQQVVQQLVASHMIPLEPIAIADENNQR